MQSSKSIASESATRSTMQHTSEESARFSEGSTGPHIGESNSEESIGPHVGESNLSEHSELSSHLRLASGDSGLSTSSPSTGHSVSSGYYSSPVQDDSDDDNDLEEREPRNFSWVVDGLLSACAFPGKRAHFRYLANQGVTHIVSLTAERNLEEEYVTEFKVTRLEVKDFTPPSMDQVIQFVKVMEEAELEKKGVVVHCAAGKGRTGTVIACFLVKRFDLSAQQAIDNLRYLRPGSVETNQQEDLVRQFYEQQRGAWSTLSKEKGQTRKLDTDVDDDDPLFRNFQDKIKLKQS